MSVAAGVRAYLDQARREALIGNGFKHFAKNSGIVPDYCAQPHDEMCEELERCIPNIRVGRKRLKKLYLAPRGTFKTSLIRALIVYCILKWRHIRIVIARAKHDEAKDALAAIKAIFKTNAVILDLWGDLGEKAAVWNEEQIQLGNQQDPTIGTSALGMSKTGAHPDLIVVDDLINDKNYDSPKITEDAWNVIVSLYAVMEPWASLLVSGTRWARNDMYGRIITEIAEDEKASREPSWSKYERGPWLPDGSLYFPERLDAVQLEQLKWDYRSNPRRFAANYLNQPYDDDTLVFKPEYLEGRFFSADFYRSPYPNLEVRMSNGEIKIVPVEVTMTIDPALTTNKRSDFTGYTVVGWDKESNWWVLMARQVKASPSTVADEMLRIIGMFNPRTCLIESAQADAGMVARIQSGIQAMGAQTTVKSYHVLRDEKHGERGKKQRIEALQPYFYEKKIWIQTGACDPFLEQYNKWPDTIDGHEDVIDALAMQRRQCTPSAYSVVEEAHDLYMAAEYDPEDEDENEMAQERKDNRVLVGRVGRSSQTLNIR